MSAYNKKDIIVCYCRGLSMRKLVYLTKRGYTIEQLIGENIACNGCGNCKEKITKLITQINVSTKGKQFQREMEASKGKEGSSQEVL